MKPLLEQGVAAVVVGVGVGVEDAGKHPALGFQDLLHLAPGVLAAAAVDEHRVLPVRHPQSHLGGALDVIGPGGGLDQFVHENTSCAYMMADGIRRLFPQYSTAAEKTQSGGVLRLTRPGFCRKIVSETLGRLVNI